MGKANASKNSTDATEEEEGDIDHLCASGSSPVKTSTSTEKQESEGHDSATATVDYVRIGQSPRSDAFFAFRRNSTPAGSSSSSFSLSTSTSSSSAAVTTATTTPSTSTVGSSIPASAETSAGYVKKVNNILLVQIFDFVHD